MVSPPRPRGRPALLMSPPPPGIINLKAVIFIWFHFSVGSLVMPNPVFPSVFSFGQFFCLLSRNVLKTYLLGFFLDFFKQLGDEKQSVIIRSACCLMALVLLVSYACRNVSWGHFFCFIFKIAYSTVTVTHLKIYNFL